MNRLYGRRAWLAAAPGLMDSAQLAEVQVVPEKMEVSLSCCYCDLGDVVWLRERDPNVTESYRRASVRHARRPTRTFNGHVLPKLRHVR